MEEDEVFLEYGNEKENFLLKGLKKSTIEDAFNITFKKFRRIDCSWNPKR